MRTFNLKRSLYIEELQGVWEKIPLNYLSILNINLKGTNVIVTAKQQFEIFYEGRSLIYSDAEKAQNAFLMIFFGTKAQFLLRQIRDSEAKLLDKLSNLDIWADITKTDSDNSGNRVSTTNGDTTSINRGGNSDANSLMEKDLVTEHFNLEKDSPIAPNALTQSKNKDTTNLTTTDNNSGNMHSINSFSNESEDIIKYINLDLPDLRQKFWSLFHCLFSY